MVAVPCLDTANRIAVVRFPAAVAVPLIDDCSGAPVPSIVAETLALAFSEDSNLIALVMFPAIVAVPVSAALGLIAVLKIPVVVADPDTFAFGLIAFVNTAAMVADAATFAFGRIADDSAAAVVADPETLDCSCAAVAVVLITTNRLNLFAAVMNDFAIIFLRFCCRCG